MQTTAVEQHTLDLGLPPGATVTLREAYDTTLLAANGIPFERALIVPHIKLGLERVAQAMAKARRAQR